MATREQSPGGDRRNFIRDIIDGDLARDLHGGRVVTRFPPEPNGYLHIGHAKSICLNFGLAQDYQGDCHLRFDDTNPSREEVEYVESIQRDVAWLGFQWAGDIRFASDYFQFMVDYAVQLIRDQKAYVDSLDTETVREYRGAFDRPGTDSPYRDRSVDENLDLFSRMRAGEFPDGAHTLQARIDMAHPNMIMRDPLLYRIKHEHHHRAGDQWCIYPMYDFAHCLEDAYEHVTHSICTLEFESNRELYDWVLDNGSPPSRPRQYEFARLSLAHTMMSKRKLLQLVEEGVVDGWDDPRMPTIAGLRRRGVTPEAIRQFCHMIGVAKNNSTVDIAKLDYCIRDDLNQRAPRVMCVLDPLKVTVIDYPEGETEEMEASYWPHDVPREASRRVPFSRELYIERGDFALEPPSGWHRLAPGREVRLRDAYFIRCQEVITDPVTGEVTELLCTHDPATRGGSAPDGRKVNGTLHWVDAQGSVPVEVRLYDRLFTAEAPGSTPNVDLHTELNGDSLRICSQARLEPAAAGAAAGERFQFVRHGYFIRDPEDGPGGTPRFNRIITLRDSWARTREASAPPEPVLAPQPRAGADKPERSRKSRTDHRRERRAEVPELAKAYRELLELGVPQRRADVLTGSEELAAFYREAASHHDPQSVARWVANDVLRVLKDSTVAELRFEASDIATLARMVDEGLISSSAGREVFGILAREGGSPEGIVEAQGLRQVSDASALTETVTRVLEAHPDEVKRYRGGQKQLLGFFVGQVMRASGGSANPQTVRELLSHHLG